MFDDATTVLLIVFIFLIVAALPAALLLASRRQKNLRAHQDDNGVLIGTQQDLTRAEAEAASAKSQIETLAEAGFVEIKQFSTTRNFTNAYMTDLVLYLEKNGVVAESVFFEAMMPGAGVSLIGPTGQFVLYTQPENKERALALIEQFLNSQHQK